MNSNLSVKVLVFQIQVAHNLGCIPIRWDSVLKRMVKISSFESEGWKFTIFRIWLALTLLGNFISIPELMYFTVAKQPTGFKVENVVTRVIFAVINQASLCYNLTTYWSRDELAPFINCLLQTRKLERTTKHNENVISFLVIIVAIASLYSALFLPVITLFQPDGHVILAKVICTKGLCTSAHWVLLFSFDLLLTQNCLLTAWPFLTLFVISLGFMSCQLKILRNISTPSCKVYEEIFFQDLALCYRKLQLLVNLYNKIFQQFLWPLIELDGALLIIAGLFCLVVLHDSIPLLVLLILLIYSLVCIAFIVTAMEVASKPMLLSRSVLNLWKRRPGRKCRWFIKFSRSCKPIYCRIGGFHAVDRSRAPIFIRFCLQRTFFLVFKTRLA